MIQPGGGLTLLPATHQRLVLGSWAYMRKRGTSTAKLCGHDLNLYSPLIWRLLQRTLEAATGAGVSV